MGLTGFNRARREAAEKAAEAIEAAEEEEFRREVKIATAEAVAEKPAKKKR